MIVETLLARGTEGDMVDDEQRDEADRSQLSNPFASALDRMLKSKAARPRDVYRLAVLMEGILDSLDKPEALATIRGELRALIYDISEASSGSS